MFLSNKPSLEDVVTRLGLQLKHNRCACPFHNGKDLNLSFNFKKQYWKCFVCGEGGDSIALYQKYHKVDFKTAIRDLNCNIIRDSSYVNYERERERKLKEYIDALHIKLTRVRCDKWLSGKRDQALFLDILLDMTDDEFYENRKVVEQICQPMLNLTHLKKLSQT